MNRIDQSFQRGKALVAYLTAGDGTLDYQLGMINALLEGGVNMLEIGVPFTDPVADGSVIQRGMQRALNAHTTLNDVFDLIKAVRRDSDVPIILFTYYNPILQVKDALKCAKEAGVDGVLVVDLPFFEGENYLKQCAQYDLAPIAVVAPSTDPERIITLAQQGKGFLYYACQRSATGVRHGLPVDLNEKIDAIKQVSHLPVIVGFGIADRESVQGVLAIAEGVVVGSYLIKAMEEGAPPAAIMQKVRGLFSSPQ